MTPIDKYLSYSLDTSFSSVICFLMTPPRICALFFSWFFSFCTQGKTSQLFSHYTSWHQSAVQHNTSWNQSAVFSVHQFTSVSCFLITPAGISQLSTKTPVEISQLFSHYTSWHQSAGFSFHQLTSISCFLITPADISQLFSHDISLQHSDSFSPNTSWHQLFSWDISYCTVVWVNIVFITQLTSKISLDKEYDTVKNCSYHRMFSALTFSLQNRLTDITATSIGSSWQQLASADSSCQKLAVTAADSSVVAVFDMYIFSYFQLTTAVFRKR